MSSYVNASTIARGRSFVSSTMVTPWAEPPGPRLHDEVALERRTHHAQDARGAELSERLVRQHDRLGHREARPGDDRARDRLRPRTPSGGTGGADRRDAEGMQQVEQRSVLAARAMQGGEHHVGALLREEGKQAGIGIAQHDPVPGRDQCIGDASSGTERDVALVGDAARQHDDVQATGITHDQGFLHYLRSEGGAESKSALGGSCSVPVPANVSSRSSSPLTTVARRRMPTRIASGVG